MTSHSARPAIIRRAEETMHVAASTLDITPHGPTHLGGYEGRPAATRTAERLEANIAAFRAPDGERAVLVSLDLLYPGRLLREALEQQLPMLRPRQLLLAASHTHQAPMTDETKPRLGVVNERYVHSVAKAVSASARQLLTSTQEVRLSAGSREAKHSVNRRLRRLVTLRSTTTGGGILPFRLNINRVSFGADPNGPTDEAVSIFVGHSTDGRPLFAIWNYACHPVGFPDSAAIAAHFPHRVRAALRQELGDPSLPVLFLQGFSGNTRPSMGAGMGTGLPRRLCRYIMGGRFRNVGIHDYDDWTRSLAQIVLAAARQASPVTAEQLVLRRARRSAEHFVLGAQADGVSFQSVRFGSDLAIIGASAEVVAEYAPHIRAVAGARVVMCVGCIDHPFGYAPTSIQIRQGGYEAGGFCPAFGLQGVAPEIETEMTLGFASVL